jgi:hypothetical protein
MVMHRILGIVVMLAAVSFFFGSFVPTLAIGADTTQTKVKAKTVHSKAHIGTKVAHRRAITKPVQARAARVNSAPATVCYSNPTSTTCYYGCIPYYSAPAVGWNAAATSGGASTSNGQSNQPVTRPQNTCGTVSTACYNTWTPSGSAPSYTWYVPATSGQAATQTYGQPTAQQAPVAAPAVPCPPVSQTQPSTVSTAAWYDGWTKWLSQPYQVVLEWAGPSCW